MSERALEVVEHVVAAGKPLSPAELQETTGIPPASMTRLLASLRESRHLKRLGRGQYAPGPRLAALSASADLPAAKASAKPVFLVMPPRNTCEELFHAIRNVIEERGINCVLQPVQGTVAGLADEELDDLSQQAAGLIFFSEQKLPEDRAAGLVARHLPSVGIGFPGHEFCDTLTWDQRHGYYEMTCRLIERGSRSIIYVGPERLHTVLQSFRDRVRGYRDAMREHGLKPDIRMVSPTIFSSEEGGRQVAEFVQQAQGDAPPGIVLSHDSKLDALAAMLVAHGFDLRGDVRLCSCYRAWRANDLSDVVPRLSLSIVEPWEEVGRVAAQRLMARARGDDTGPVLTLTRPEIVAN